jgi:hypothetical protein
VACRASTSTYYEWLKRPPSKRDLEDAYVLDTIIEVHTTARATYGVRRVHAELVLGRSHYVGRGRVARLMACTTWPESTGGDGFAISTRRRRGPITCNAISWPAKAG